MHVTMLGNVVLALLFGLMANTDNLAVGIAYGMKRRRILLRQNSLIAVVTTTITLVALAAGRQFRAALPLGLPDTVGGVLLICLASWSFYRERAVLAGTARDRPLNISDPQVQVGESLFLASALSINNVGLAIVVGIEGVDYISAALSVLCFSMGMLAFGQAISRTVTRLEAVHRVLCCPAIGNGVLALAGVFVILI